MLKQMITHLEAENAYKKKNLDNVSAEAGNARINEDTSMWREQLAQLEAENKKLPPDLSNALDDAKRSLAELSRARDVDNKIEQRLANLKN
nr:unnamed protein product [Callosobruchus chinensis]